MKMVHMSMLKKAINLKNLITDYLDRIQIILFIQVIVKLKNLLENRGSSFFVDSYGLHKGKVPEKNSRILLNIHFGLGKILYSSNDISMKINNS